MGHLPVTQTAPVRMMTETFLQRKEDREGGGREYERKDYHKAMQTGNLTVLGIKYCYI